MISVNLHSTVVLLPHFDMSNSEVVLWSRAVQLDCSMLALCFLDRSLLEDPMLSFTHLNQIHKLLVYLILI